MRLPRFLSALMALGATSLWAQQTFLPGGQVHQAPDVDGVYYTGPEVAAPRLIRTVFVPYPDGFTGKEIQGMTVLAMVIAANGIPEHIQVLHTHGEAFDQMAIAAVKQSSFEPGKLGDKPVPVWIDVRAVFTATAAQLLLKSSSPRGTYLLRMNCDWRTSVTTLCRTRRLTQSTRLTRTSPTRLRRTHSYRWPHYRCW